MGAEIGLGVPISAALFTEYCTDSFAFAEFHCGALEILVDLKRHDLMLGITSNGEARIQIGNIRALGLDHLIHEILISELEGVRKPDILIFERAAQRLGVDPAECLFVGDNLAADILGAKQAGMKSVWFRPDPVPVPINSGPLRPDYCISRLEEVLTIYKSLKMNY
jgi:putative hydrolase of the HAD superfamily